MKELHLSKCRETEKDQLHEREKSTEENKMESLRNAQNQVRSSELPRFLKTSFPMAVNYFFPHLRDTLHFMGLWQQQQNREDLKGIVARHHVCIKLCVVSVPGCLGSSPMMPHH